MNWDDLQIVLAISRQGTVTKAAQELGVNQTTVTRRLQGLQEQIGVRLFEKLHRGCIPTATGEEFIKVAETVEASILSLETKVMGQDAQLEGIIKVTVPILFVSEPFRSFLRHYPNIKLEVSVDVSTKNLVAREADIALRLSDQPAENLFGRKVARVEYALYAAKELVKELGMEPPFDRFPWISWNLELGAKLTEDRIHQYVKNPNIVCRVNFPQAMVDFVKGGMGISFIPCVMGDTDPNLIRLRPVEPGFGVDLWILTHPDLKDTARVRALMAHIGQEYRKLKELFEGKHENHWND